MTVQIISDHGVTMTPTIIKVFSQYLTGRGFRDPPICGIEPVECIKYRCLREKDRFDRFRAEKITVLTIPANQ
jgi:hypothetical protein